MTRPRLPRSLRDYHGIPPQRRDELTALAASVAMSFRWAVARGNAHEIQAIRRELEQAAGDHLTEAVFALAIIFAEAAQPGSFRLRDVTEAAQDEAAKGRGAA